MKESQVGLGVLLLACACSHGTHWSDGSSAAAPDASSDDEPEEGNTVTMDGFDLEAEPTEDALHKVARDAVGRLECSEDELSYRMLDVIDDAGADMPRKISVSGCGKRTIYCCGSEGNWEAGTVETFEGDPKDKEWWCFAGEAGGRPIGACSPKLDKCAHLAERAASQGVSGGTACGRVRDVVCFHATRGDDEAAKVFRCFPSVATCERERGNHGPTKGWALTTACAARTAPSEVASEVPTGDPCAAGDAAACMKAANDLRAKGDDKGSLVLLSKACSLGEAVACLDVGRALEDGRGTDRDPERAADFYKKGCQLGADGACDEFARVRATPAATPKTKAKAKRT